MVWKSAQKLIHNWKILRGDDVMIIRGKDKGEKALINRVIRSQNRVIVEGKNLVKKHIKQGQGHEGGIFTLEAPLHVSNVQVLDPVTEGPCKVGIKYLEDGTKVRVSRGQGASGNTVPRPEILKIRPLLGQKMRRWNTCWRGVTMPKLERGSQSSKMTVAC
ncbi:50S ribosomal protein L24-like [Rhodamnia argentea]|uniref:50S ribosomal protein L24-like n=1 Tax=Rhodamnia argentea TaxID=178133 RepID=A0A8B8QIA9_9MYRT|nr:50S ribosomal protein L24-like [Rhodamnia argentea]